MMKRIAGLAFCSMILASTMAGDAAIKVVGYHNVHIAVTDQDKAIAWYAEHLGGKRSPTQPNVMIGETLIVFMKAATQPSAGGAIDHIGLSFPDVDAKVAELVAAGAKVLTAPRDAPGLFRLAFIEDPWGTKIELTQDAEWPNFHHVHLRGTDATATLDWYQSLLGGTRDKLKGKIDGLRYGGVWLLVDTRQGAPLVPSGEAAITMAAWSVANVDDAAVEFKAKGAKTIVEPRAVAPTVRMAMFADPNGASVELLQFPPAK